MEQSSVLNGFYGPTGIPKFSTSTVGAKEMQGFTEVSEAFTNALTLLKKYVTKGNEISYLTIANNIQLGLYNFWEPNRNVVGNA